MLINSEENFFPRKKIYCDSAGWSCFKGLLIARSATSVRALLKSIASVLVCMYVCPDKMDAKNDSQISISRTKKVADGIRNECFDRVF